MPSGWRNRPRPDGASISARSSFREVKSTRKMPSAPQSMRLTNSRIVGEAGTANGNRYLECDIDIGTVGFFGDKLASPPTRFDRFQVPPTQCARFS